MLKIRRPNYAEAGARHPLAIASGNLLVEDMALARDYNQPPKNFLKSPQFNPNIYPMYMNF